MPFLTIAGIEVLVTDLSEREPEYIGDAGRSYSGAWRGDTSGEIRAWQGTGLEVAASKYHELRSAVRRGAVSVQGDAIYGGWPRRMRVQMSGDYIRDGATYLVVPGFTMEDAQVHAAALHYYPGSGLLTHSRADAAPIATYMDRRSLIRTVSAAGDLRDAHYMDGVRHTLLELSRTGQLFDSSDISTANWSKSASITLASATSILDGYTARKATTSTLSGRVNQLRGTFTGNSETLAAILEVATGAKSTQVILQVFDTTTSTQVARLELDTTTGVVSNVVGTEYVETIAEVGPNGGTVWRVDVSATGTAGNSREVRIYPDFAEGAKAVIVHYAQVEEAAFGTSPIVTGGATVTRAVDAASLALPTAIADPRTAWARYTRWVAGMDGNGGLPGPRIWQIGSESGGFGRLILHWTSPSALTLAHDNGPNVELKSVSGLSVSRGDTVEAVVVWNGDGTGTLAVSVNGGAVASAALSGLAPSSQWNGGASSYLNGRDSGGDAGAMSLRDDLFMEGVPTGGTAAEHLIYLRGEAA